SHSQVPMRAASSARRRHSSRSWRARVGSPSGAVRGRSGPVTLAPPFPGSIRGESTPVPAQSRRWRRGDDAAGRVQRKYRAIFSRGLTSRPANGIMVVERGIRMRLRVFAIALSLCALVGAARVQAELDPFGEGLRLFKEQQYAEALKN